MNKYNHLTRYSFTLLLILCFAAFYSKSQNVERLEYFVDSDPGFGNGQKVTIVPGLEVTTNFQFNVDSFYVGFHNLYVRAFVNPYTILVDGKTISKGGWSHTLTRTYYKENISHNSLTLPNITKGEFYIDIDPGFGNGNNIPIATESNNSNISFAFDVTVLSAGFHNLFVRFKDSNGKWSLCSIRNFYKELLSNDINILPYITRGEYFIDTDPGFGNGNDIQVNASNNITDLNFTFDLTPLSSGFHNLYVRFMNEKGIWSLVNVRNFYKEEVDNSNNDLVNIIGGEFFIDSDPGFGKGTDISIAPGPDLKELSFISDITVIANGFHNISTRFKDANGKWSHTNSRSFYKESFTSSMPLSNIIQLEYFVDTDPGFGSGSSVSLTPAIDIPSLAFTIDMTKVSIGNHKIYVRALDANGKWSLVSTGSFVVEPPEDVYITIGDIAGNACASSPIVIPFKVNIPYGSNNIFTAQLSDGNGNFANPIIIGSLTGSTSDTINALIPANTPIGNGYRVRILASSPLDTSTESSTSFIIQRAPEQPFSINGKTQVCVGTEFYTASNVESGAKFEWVLSSGGTIDTSGINAKVNWNLQGTHLLSFTTSNTCGIGRTQILSISVFNAPPSLIPTIIISNGRDLSVDNSNSTNISGYAWYFNDTLISEALYSSYFAIKDGVYKVRYSNPCGIGPASDSLVITTLQNQFIFFDTIPDKVFGDSSFIIHATASSGLPVTYRLENGPATLNNNVITISGAGFVTISALQEGNNKYDAANAARTFKVDKAAAQIHLNNLSQVYDGNPKFPTSTTTPAGLQIEYLFNGAINPPVNAGLYPVIATINDINYYGSLTETFRINKADQVITFASIADKEYGSNPITIQTSSSSKLPVSLAIHTNPENIAALSGNTISILGVGVVIISASQHGNDNFNAATDIADTFSIVKANQLISITSLPDVTIDSSIVRLNASVNSGLPLIYSITTDPVIGVAELSGSIINLLRHKGTIIVYVSQAGNQFYNSTIIQRVFNVLGRSQSIAFLPILNKSFGDASFTLNATASSQLPVSFTLVNGVGFISGNQLTIASAGTITVEANQAGDDTINPAPPVRQTFLANKATQTIAVDSIPDKTFGDSIFSITGRTSSGLPLNYKIISGNAVISENNFIEITGAGLVTIRATQNGNQNYLPASADITFCISATKPSHINGFAVSCPSIQEYSIDPIPGAMYTWTLSDGGSILSSVGNKISVNWTGIGVHKLSVYASSICKVKMNDSTSIDIKIINPVVPSDVTNLFPVSSTVITRFPFSLSWLASGANEVYDLYVWPEGTQQPTMPIIVDTNGVAYLIFNGYQLPGFAPGKKYLWKVITKNSCLQSNGISSSFVISELPNLVLQSVEAPDNTFSGNSIDITIKVLNKGKASTLSTRWTDAVYLSRDTIFNASFDVYVGGVGNLSALDSGQEYLNTFRLNLPQNIIGDYHLIVVTNVFNTLTEVTITDNSIIKPILINLTPPPDLQVTSVIPPNEAFSGQFIDITYTVKNKGTGQTNSAQWDDYLYISPDPVFDRNTAFKLGERSHNQLKAIRLSGPLQLTYLLPDSSYTNTVRVLLPTRFFGIYYIFVETDIKNTVYEFTFENNNTNRNDSIKIFLTPPPDFIVQDFVTPSNISSQEILKLEYKILNNGATAPIGTDHKWLDGIYLTKDSIFNYKKAILLDFTIPFTRIVEYPECGYELAQASNSSSSSNSSGGSSGGSSPISGPISGTAGGYFFNKNLTEYCSTQSAFNIQYYRGMNGDGYYLGTIGCGKVSFYTIMISGESYSNKISAIIPDSLEGIYYLHLFTDFTNEVFEFQQENNNTRGAKIIIKNPDLIVDSIDVINSASSGNNINLSWIIKNQGEGKVFNKNRKDLIWLSRNPVYNRSNMIRVDSLTYCTSISNGATTTKQKSIKIPDGLDGQYYLFIETDFDKNIFEGKAENNNYSSKPINIQLTPWPDLKMNAVKISKDPVDFEEDFTVEDSVSNDGTLAILGRPWKDLIYIANDTLKPTAIIKDLKGHEILQTQSLKTNEFYKNNLIERVSNDILDPINPDTTFYVYAIADYKNNIYEHTGENNNIKRTKITIRNVDLAVTKVDGSTNVFSGQNANLNWVVLNNGGKTGLFANGWIDQVYLSKDTIFDAQDTMLIYREINGPILSNDSYNSDIIYQVPNGYSGNYYIFLNTDASNGTHDNNRLNNINTIRDQNGLPKPIDITLTPSPDLIVTNFQFPTLGYTGQPITIKWEVKNNGIGPTRSGGWKERIYLATNPNSSQGINLGVYNRRKDLASGESYDDSLTLFIPMILSGNYYVIFETDGEPSKVYEHNAENNNRATSQIFIIRPLPSDLIVKDIENSSQVLVGDSITVKWTIKNIGVNPAQGYFTQGIYLSNDTSWSVDDVLILNPIVNNTFISPLEELIFSKRIQVQGVKDGKYFVIVRTDLINNIFENNESNNTSVSTDTVNVSILDLPLNVLKSNLLYIKKELYYKLDIPDSLDGETVLVSLNSNKQITPNELYIKFGNVPTRASFDFEYEKANSGNQEILIPNALIGTYYILAYNDSAIGTQNISLLAEKINFSIRSVLTAEGGNTGLVTTKIRGAKFEPNMQIRLQHNVLGTITANNVQYINNTTLFVTFNLSGKTASIYNVKATKNNKDSTILQNGFIILKGSGGGFQTGGTTAGGFYCSIKNIGVDPLLGVDVQSPGGVRPFQFFKMDINFGNSGNVDISLPHRLLVSVSGLPIALSQAELASAAKKEIYLEFKEVNGPIGILRPGVTGSITIYSQGAGFGRFSFRLIE